MDTTNVAYRESGGLAWGVGNTPITYDPPVSDPSELQVELQPEPEGPDMVPCYRQVEPARQLVNLTDIPVLFMNADGGYHRIFDHCLANWLNQAGVSTEYVRMEDVGLAGNGHMMMLELNSKEIAEYITGCSTKTSCSGHPAAGTMAVRRKRRQPSVNTRMAVFPNPIAVPGRGECGDADT